MCISPSVTFTVNEVVVVVVVVVYLLHCLFIICIFNCSLKFHTV